jgi:hypothetical protein
MGFSVIFLYRYRMWNDHIRVIDISIILDTHYFLALRLFKVIALFQYSINFSQSLLVCYRRVEVIISKQLHPGPAPYFLSIYHLHTPYHY